MESFASLLRQSSQNKVLPKWWLGGMVAFSFAGFLDAVYLTVQHYSRFEVPCSFAQGCEVVLTSAYATMFGIPVALLGAGYYLAIFLSVIAFLNRKKPILLTIALVLPQVGFLFTIWFVFAQIALLKALCLYCLLSALLTTLLFLLSMYYVWYGRFKGFWRKRKV